MRYSIEAIMFGFREILNWNTMKYALIIGFIVISLWIGIGYLLWDLLVSIGSSILDMVPFSMVRSNGAWMLSTFVWLQVVIITFAIIYVFLGNLILSKISKEKYTSLSFFIGMGSAIFWAIIWFLNSSYIHNEFVKLLTWLPFETVEKGIGYLFAIYIIYNAIVITILFIVSIFSEPLLKHIESQYFKETKIKKENIFKTFKYKIKDAFIFIIVSILAFPLLFIPFLNFIVQIVLWMWLVKDTLQYDSALLAFGDIEKSKLKKSNVTVWFISFITVLFNFVPIFNIFSPLFGEISMFYYWNKIKEQEKNQ
jgi:hypothetical protein